MKLRDIIQEIRITNKKLFVKVTGEEYEGEYEAILKMPSLDAFVGGWYTPSRPLGAVHWTSIPELQDGFFFFEDTENLYWKNLLKDKFNIEPVWSDSHHIHIYIGPKDFELL